MAYTSPQLYEMLVPTRGWPLERYSDFITDTLIGVPLCSRPHHQVAQYRTSVNLPARPA